jgi:hypothetical protein
MGMHEGKGHQSSASKVFTDEVVDGFSILESTQQSRKAVRLIIQRKHCLVNDRKSGVARLSQCPSLGDPILEYGQLLSFRAISLEIIGNQIGVRLGCTKMRVHAMSLSFFVNARVCIQQKR